MHLYPLLIATMANPIPVFPEVPSIIVPPGFNNPFFSASSIIVRAILSSTEFPGLKVSYLASTVHGRSFTISFNLIRGVFPIVCKIFSKNCIEIYFVQRYIMHLIIIGI